MACSLPGPLPAAQHAQLEFPGVRQDNEKRHKKNKTVIDKTAETRERLNMAASCLSFCRSATHALTLSLSLSASLSYSTIVRQQTLHSDSG